MGIMGPAQLFWAHEAVCRVCTDHHPQSPSSFVYEPLCPIGMEYARAGGLLLSHSLNINELEQQ